MKLQLSKMRQYKRGLFNQTSFRSEQHVHFHIDALSSVHISRTILLSNYFVSVLLIVNQSISQSVNQSVNQSINQSINQSNKQTISQSINQSSVNQSINQSI